MDERFLIKDWQPAYLKLYQSGELQKRVEEAVKSLAECTVCPRDCKVNRLEDKTATCKTGRYATVSSYFAHRGEEDPLRGRYGSGTIFFSMCNLRCVFCQNYDISQAEAGLKVTAERLANMMLELQRAKCHNINFVTPEHVVPQMLEGLLIAIEKGLRLPIVYNTSAYDSLESLRLLDGIIDIYMPDFKFMDSDLSLKYLKAKDYPEVAKRVFREMRRQVGDLKMDTDGIAKRGLLVRHLVMPGLLDDTHKIMQFLATEISKDTYVNVMAQYRPEAKVSATQYRELNRRLVPDEYLEAVQTALKAGLWRLDERKPFLFF